MLGYFYLVDNEELLKVYVYKVQCGGRLERRSRDRVQMNGKEGKYDKIWVGQGDGNVIGREKFGNINIDLEMIMLWIKQRKELKMIKILVLVFELV